MNFKTLLETLIASAVITAATVLTASITVADTASTVTRQQIQAYTKEVDELLVEMKTKPKKQERAELVTIGMKMCRYLDSGLSMFEVDARQDEYIKLNAGNLNRAKRWSNIYNAATFSAIVNLCPAHLNAYKVYQETKLEEAREKK